MTMKELNQLNRRLSTESDVENLILRVKRNNGEKWDRHTRPTVNVSTPIGQMYPQYDEAFRDKTIIQLTMDELVLLMDRLREETRAQDRILDLKRMNGEEWDYDDEPVVSTDTPVNQLYHHGILGMKWGVRKRDNMTTIRTKTSSKKGTDDKTEEKPKSADFMNSRILKSKASSGLSNEDLRKLNERLNLEKQYKDLTKDTISKGKNYLSDSVASGLKKTATTFVAASSLYAVKKLIETTMGDTVATEMFPSLKKK